MTHAHATLLVTLLLAARAAAASDIHIEFEAFLDARPVGTHRFDIQGTDGARTVTSVAAFDVKILGIVAYRYRHQATTRWQQGCLTQISASTDDNGHATQVMGAMRGGNFELQQPTRGAARTGCVVGYAYWDPAILTRQHELLNPQTGQFDAVRIEPMGEETLAIRNTQVKADRYRLSNGKQVIDLWYSKSGEWLQLETTTSTKRKLHYRLIEK